MLKCKWFSEDTLSDFKYDYFKMGKSGVGIECLFLSAYFGGCAFLILDCF